MATLRQSFSSVFFLVFAIGPHVASAVVFPLEAERFMPNSTFLRNRADASGGQTVHLTPGEEVTLTFCLRRTSYVSISNGVYSNDGRSDKVVIRLDHTDVGSFSSKQHSHFGDYWGVMVSSGSIGKPFSVPSGEHSLVLKVESADEYGIEIDKVDLFVSDSGLTEWDVKCLLPCLDDSQTNLSPGRDDVLPAKVEQRSRSTSCAEEDNVKIPVYHDTARRYRLTASLPTYQPLTNLNKREADFSSCDIFSSELWQIGNDDGLSDEFRNYSSPDGSRTFEVSGASGDFPGVINFGSVEKITLDLTFRVDGPSRGSQGSEVGSVLTINLTDILPGEDFQVGLRFRGRTAEYSTTDYKSFSSENTLHTWDIPDFTWLESSENSIRLVLKNPHYKQFPNGKEGAIKFDFIRLNMRRERGEKVFTIYSSKDVIVEGLEVDFWWLSPNTMKLRRTDTEETWSRVDFFRVYVRIPYSASFEQIFVMYQDGNVRLLPLPPNHLDWIPFGSSVIVGQTDASSFRPYAAIQHVDLNPQKLQMTLTYKDGGNVRLKLINKISKTILQIEEATYARDTNAYPFMMLRSMWVDDTNNDVEKVSSAGSASVTRHILGNWKPFFSPSVLFHRKCVSRHNTLSPDIRLDMLP
ncbi:uncharacterized protein LOC135482256 [Liolophura sinensis]|uniref:uncharacterized protein LOC135482256 n=1 Tax=Liolophura sinensis TaxID=3198878 RepID=UPI003158B83F